MEVQCLMSHEHRCGDAEMHMRAWPVVDPSTAATMVLVTARFSGPEERSSVEETSWSLRIPDFAFDTEDGRQLPWDVLSSLPSLSRDAKWSTELPFMEQEVFDFIDRAARVAAGRRGCGGIEVLVDIGCSNAKEQDGDDDDFEVENDDHDKAVEEEVGVEGSSEGYVTMFYGNRGLETMLAY